MRKTTAVLVMALFIGVCSCSKENNHPSPFISIDGYDLFDADGQYVSHYGPHDKDWHFDDSLSPAELRLFDFPTPYSLKNTVPSIIHQNMLAYPIPCYHSLNLDVEAPDSVLLRIVVTDSNLNVLEQFSYKIKGSWKDTLLLDETLFPAGSSRRFYFSASADHAPNYQVGFGDIKICDETGEAKYTSCFQ